FGLQLVIRARPAVCKLVSCTQISGKAKHPEVIGRSTGVSRFRGPSRSTVSEALSAAGFSGRDVLARACTVPWLLLAVGAAATVGYGFAGAVSDGVQSAGYLAIATLGTAMS